MSSTPVKIAHIEEAIALFIGQIANKNSAKAYRFDLLQLAAFLLACDTRFEEMTPEQATRYVQSLSAGGLSTHAIRRRISAARSFYRYMLSQGIVGSNPFSDVRAPTVHPKEEAREVLLKDEFERCLRVLTNEVRVAYSAAEADPLSHGLRRRQFYAVRRRAVVVLLATTGLRLSELLAMEQSAIEMVDSRFQIRIEGTGSRRIPLTTTCLPALVDWLKLRMRIPTPHPHFFVGYDGSPCSRMTIRQIMKWLQKRVETRHPLNARLFRRSFKLHLETQCDLWVGRDLLGNGDISTADKPIALSETQLGLLA